MNRRRTKSFIDRRSERIAAQNRRHFDFTALPDGALPYPWIGGTFTVSSGVVTNTPTNVGGNLLTDPGLEVAYTAGKCDTLTKGGAPTLVESADVHGGAKAQSFVAVAANDRLNYPVVAGVAGEWYRASIWGKKTAGTTQPRLRLYQANSVPFPGNSVEDTINGAAYSKEKVSSISTTNDNIYVYPAVEVDGAAFGTVIIDDGTLERLTYSTLFAMISKPVSRLATVKINPSALVDSTMTGAVMWSNASGSPTTYIMAVVGKYSASADPLIGLLKCVAGTYTTLIAPGYVAAVANAWLEIRPVSNTVIGMYYNNVQVGANQTVANVPGNYCGFCITGGNNVKGFRVG